MKDQAADEAMKRKVQSCREVAAAKTEAEKEAIRKEHKRARSARDNAKRKEKRLKAIEEGDDEALIVIQNKSREGYAGGYAAHRKDTFSGGPRSIALLRCRGAAGAPAARRPASRALFLRRPACGERRKRRIPS